MPGVHGHVGLGCPGAAAAVPWYEVEAAGGAAVRPVLSASPVTLPRRVEGRLRGSPHTLLGIGCTPRRGGSRGRHVLPALHGALRAAESFCYLGIGSLYAWRFPPGRLSVGRKCVGSLGWTSPVPAFPLGHLQGALLPGSCRVAPHVSGAWVHLPCLKKGPKPGTDGCKLASSSSVHLYLTAGTDLQSGGILRGGHGRTGNFK